MLPLEGAWDYAEKRKDYKRFLIALTLSVALHITVLAPWTPAPQQSSMDTGSSALTVVMLKRPAPSPVTEQTLGKETQRDTKHHVLIQAESSHSIAYLKPQRKNPGEQRAVSIRQKFMAKHGVQDAQANTPPSGKEPQPTLHPGEVIALLTIGEDGRVEHIHWDQLPALTDAQLVQVESHIRSKIYVDSMAGRTVKEVVNVRALAGLLE